MKIGGYVSLEKGRSLESLLSRSTFVGSPDFMDEYDFAYTYYYSVRSSSSEYSSSIMSLRKPSFITPTYISVGGKMGDNFLQVSGNFWGSYRDLVGDYQSEVVNFNLIRENTILGRVGTEVFYTHFRRSAYVGSYPVDTGGGSVVIDFYEEWIYRDGFGMKFTQYNEDYELKSGFASIPDDRITPLFLEFRKIIGDYSLHIKQVAFWGSSALPPKVLVGADRELSIGRKSLQLRGYFALLLKPSDFFGLKSLPIAYLSARYASYSPSGEMVALGRLYTTKVDKNEIGGELYVSYTFARRYRPQTFAGFIFTRDDKGPYVGLSFGVFRKRLQLAYYHPRKAISLGLEVSNGIFGI